MLPVADDVPVRGRPWLTWLLVATVVGVHLAQWLAPPEAIAPLYDWACVDGAVVRHRWQELVTEPRRVLREPGSFLREALVPFLVQPIVHAGPAQCLVDALFLRIFGDNVEDRVGRVALLLLFLAGSTVAVLVQGVLATAGPRAAVGASGAVAGLLGAFLVLYPKAHLRLWVVFVTVEINTAQWLVLWVILQAPFVVMLLAREGRLPLLYTAQASAALCGALLIWPLLVLRGRRAERTER